MSSAQSAITFNPADYRDTERIFPACSKEEMEKRFRAFFDRPWAALTASGRGAIDAVLRSLKLERDDEVFVTTTFDYPNVSSCVTSTIFNHCKPARLLSEKSKAILVIHEFGVPHKGTPQLRELADQRGIPLIEDCAHTIDSYRDDWQVGYFGDFVIVSFSKLFPVAGGGMLLGKAIPCELTDRELQSVIPMLPAAADALDAWPEHARRRREVFRTYGAAGLPSIFDVDESVTPWFFPLETPLWEDVMAAAAQHNIDCGRWHGTEIVVLPCHQYLSAEDVGRVAALVTAVLAAQA